MKYIILIGDGMADNRIGELGDKTPLEFANTPNLDSIGSKGLLGLFATVPPGFPPGSDVANLSIFGYDPVKYYTGRAPLEAASIGVKLGAKDMAFRCNLVTIADRDGKAVMDDYSAGHITTEDADGIIKSLDKELASQGVRFYTGTSYRHLMVWKDSGATGKTLKTTPPHDISDREVAGHFPTGKGAEKLKALIELSQAVLKDHPVNKRRIAEGKNPATSIWLWGQGVAPDMPSFKELYGLTGSVISAVDLVKGIGHYAKLKVIDVPGATGYLDTNYEGKVDYALKSLEEVDLTMIHIESTDETGHVGKAELKIQAIEDFDGRVVGRVLEGIKRFGDYKILVMSDHPTPIDLRTHVNEPVPFAIYSSEDESVKNDSFVYTEKSASTSPVFISEGWKLLGMLIGREI